MQMALFVNEYSKWSPIGLRPLDKALCIVTSCKFFSLATLSHYKKTQNPDYDSSLPSWTCCFSEKVRPDWHSGGSRLLATNLPADSSGWQAPAAPPLVPGGNLAQWRRSLILLMFLNWLSNRRTGTFPERPAAFIILLLLFLKIKSSHT